MLTAEFVSFEKSKALNRLLNDYLQQKPELRPYYEEYPSVEGFKNLLQKNPYQNFDRAHLVSTLTQQAQSVNNTTNESLSQIQALAATNTYTLTTGHQLCLFTGPLYFIYKIFSVINLAEELKRQFPKQHFVPVYWMATEDHDFEEINHLYVNDEKIAWQSAQKGAVGHFLTEELKALLPVISKALGKSKNATYLRELFERAYLQNKTLTQATRYLVNELFGEYGLVIIDGDDKQFKKQFIEECKADLFSHTAYSVVGAASAGLAEMDYHLQVNAREINLFLLGQQSRLRIEKQKGGFALQDKSVAYSSEELEKMLHESPELFSPNVILRPLYQQKILPNLAYIGGPGELAYWLQFKPFFDNQNIQYPLLVPRNFVTVVPASSVQKLQKLNLESSAVFTDEVELVKQLQISTKGLFDLSEEEVQLKHLYEKIRLKAIADDKSLDAKVAADLQRALNALEVTSEKVNRSRRRKMTEEKLRLQQIHDSIFVGDTPRERHDNFSNLFLAYGKEFFTVLKKELHPLKLQHLLLIERA